MLMCVGYNLGIVAGAKLESFLASSASFFLSRHLLVYELPKPARRRRLVVSLYPVILSVTIDNAIDCGLSPPTSSLYQVSALYQIFNACDSESGQA